MSVEAAVMDESSVTSSHRGGRMIWSSSCSWTSSSGRTTSSGTCVSKSSFVESALEKWKR